MAFIFSLLYLCLLLSLIAIGTLLTRSLIEAIRERHRHKDAETEYYTRLWKEFQKENRAIYRKHRMERKHTRKERREKNKRRRKFEREERRFKRALNHIDTNKLI